jgi:hypothetical protein
MRKKIIGIFVCMLLITIILPITVMAGDEKNPEIKDKTGDILFKHADIISVWFHEDKNNPSNLYISFKVRDLINRTQTLETIYVVDWGFRGNTYSVDFHVFPYGVSEFYSGKWNINDNEYESFVICNGIFDIDNNIITWITPKDAIGNPHPGDLLTEPFASTHLRFPFSSIMPHWDLFRDLSWNAWYRKDYTIQF